MVVLNPAAELRRIAVEEARRHLIPYVSGNQPNYQAGWVHHEIAAELEQFSRDVVAGLSPRLMIFMPPRHGKSALASINFPAWHLGRNPHHEIILSSYSGDLGADFSGQALETCKGEWHQEVFPSFALKGRKPKNAKWRTLKGGGMTGTGVGGSITGRGAHIAILDDLVKNWEEAVSDTIRQKTWDFWASTVRTRLAPGGGVILIMTRWHEDDVAGRILEQMKEPGARQWKVIEYPAIAERDEKHRKVGEALHPERYPLSELREIEREVGPRVWTALYRQKPRPLGGQYIQSAWFKQITPAEVPKEAKFQNRFWDLAVKAKKANDETASVQLAVVKQVPEGGKKPLEYVYARRMQAFKKEWPDTKKTIVSTAISEKGVVVGIEANSAFDIAAQEIRTDLKGKAVVRGITVSEDKLTRALPWMDIAEAGRFFLVADTEGSTEAPWIPAFLGEAEAWDPMQPKQQDNRIDAVSGCYMMAGGRKKPGVH